MDEDIDIDTSNINIFDINDDITPPSKPPSDPQLLVELEAIDTKDIPDYEEKVSKIVAIFDLIRTKLHSEGEFRQLDLTFPIKPLHMVTIYNICPLLPRYLESIESYIISILSCLFYFVFPDRKIILG